MTTVPIEEIRALRRLVMALDEILAEYVNSEPDPTEAADLFLASVHCKVD